MRATDDSDQIEARTRIERGLLIYASATQLYQKIVDRRSRLQTESMLHFIAYRLTSTRLSTRTSLERNGSD